MTKIKKTKINKINTTSDVLSKNDITNLIEIRIQDSENIYVKNTGDTYLNILEEIYQKRCPLTLRKKLPDDSIDEWNVNDMVFPQYLYEELKRKCVNN